MIVYLVTNLANGKRYVGKTIFTLEKRWVDHVSASRRPHSQAYKRMRVVRAIARDGPENFTRKVIEVCDSMDAMALSEQRHIREHNTTDPAVGYNGTIGGEGIVPTPETRAKMSAAQLGRKHTEESKARMSASHKGWKPSDETRKKMSESHAGLTFSDNHKDALSVALTGREFTQEHKENIRLSKLGKPSHKTRTIGAFDPVTNELVATYASAVEANRLSNGRFKRPAICEVCNGNRNLHAGLRWRYLD